MAGTGLWLADRASAAGSIPVPTQPTLCDGALLCRHGADRRYDPLGGPWHDSAAGALRAPDLDARALRAEMHRLAPQWLRGCRLRPCWFEPTFQKHVGALCSGLQIDVDDPAYEHAQFRPWRLVALALKALRRLRPDYALWRDFAYEYEQRLAFDVINGSELLRSWVDDPQRPRAIWRPSRHRMRRRGWRSARGCCFIRSSRARYGAGGPA